MIWFLFNLLWRSEVIVILAMAATASVRKQPAELANLIWRAALVGILLLPMISALGPVFPIPTVTYKVDMSSPEVMRQAGPQLERAVKASMSHRQSSDPVVSGSIPPHRSIDIWLLIAVAVYALCAGVVALRWVTSRSKVLAALGRSEPVPEWSTESFFVLMANEGPSLGPLTFGARRPVILLPAHALSWSDERRQTVLIHETAHVGRRDYAWQTLADATCALLWFNPAAWLVSKRLRTTAEEAADDEALRSGVAASTYARELLSFIRPRDAHGFSLARRATIEGRMRRILSASVTRTPARPRTVFTLLGVATVLCSAVAGTQVTSPRLISDMSDSSDVRGYFVDPQLLGNKDDEFTARFPCGHTIKLVALAEHTGEGKLRQWSPDGTPMAPTLARVDTTWRSWSGIHYYLQTDAELPKESVHLQLVAKDRQMSSMTSAATRMSMRMLVTSGDTLFHVDQPSIYCLMGYYSNNIQARLTFSRGKMSVDRLGRVDDKGRKLDDECILQHIRSLTDSHGTRQIVFESPHRTDLYIDSRHANNLTFMGPGLVGVGDESMTTGFIIKGEPSPESWIDIKTRSLDVSGFEGVHLSPVASAAPSQAGIRPLPVLGW